MIASRKTYPTVSLMAQIETARSCTDELKHKPTAEQDRATTAQMQIELSTEINEQSQLRIADLTTSHIEQLRNRSTEHNSKQTDALTVTVAPETAAPQKVAAVAKTRVLPRAAAERQVVPKKAPARLLLGRRQWENPTSRGRRGGRKGGCH